MGRPPESDRSSFAIERGPRPLTPLGILEKSIEPRDRKSTGDKLREFFESGMHVVVITGPPGSGKSTFLRATEQLLRQEVQPRVPELLSIISLAYEAYFAEFLQRKEAELGQPIPDRVSRMTPEMAEECDIFISTRLVADLSCISDPNTYVLIELPAVGPRGEHFLKTLGEVYKKTTRKLRKDASLSDRAARELAQNGEFRNWANKTCILQAVADVRVYRFVQEIRSVAATLNESPETLNDYFLKTALLTFNLNYAGAPSEQDKQSTALLDSFLQMASPEIVQSILQEYDAIAEEIYEELKSRNPEVVAFAKLAIQSPGSDIHPEDWEKNTSRALASYSILQRLLGANVDRFTVAFNPMNTAGIVYL
jgi:energy-coupling factor transporter ATP-binding protein EcfA2